ncbi:MAG: class I SAM-dependent methyltransferase [Desulfurococcales archaeon]|nr:class I SAM-dependent methyltransferase [Desulfurococcales archaeon]
MAGVLSLQTILTAGGGSGRPCLGIPPHVASIRRRPPKSWGCGLLASAPLFDRLARRYEGWHLRHRVTAENEERLVREAMRGAPRPCLEVGVGTGFFAAAAGCEAGVDPSLGMLSMAAGRVPLRVQGRGEALPFASGSLGSVLVSVTLCFADDPQMLLAEASRALRPGGRLVACIVPRDTPWGRLYRSRGRLGHPLYRAARFYTLREVRSMAEAAGLKAASALATLTYPPWGRPRPEKPRPPRGGEGFACLIAVKPGG